MSVEGVRRQHHSSAFGTLCVVGISSRSEHHGRNNSARSRDTSQSSRALDAATAAIAIGSAISTCVRRVPAQRRCRGPISIAASNETVAAFATASTKLTYDEDGHAIRRATKRGFVEPAVRLGWRSTGSWANERFTRWVTFEIHFEDRNRSKRECIAWETSTHAFSRRRIRLIEQGRDELSLSPEMTTALRAVV